MWPRYDFRLHAREAADERIAPRPFVILEGLHALHRESLRAAAHRRVFIDTPLDVCLARRIRRDTTERGRSAVAVRAQFETTVVPMYERYVAPLRAEADVVVNGADALPGLVASVVSRLRAPGSVGS